METETRYHVLTACGEIVMADLSCQLAALCILTSLRNWSVSEEINPSGGPSYWTLCTQGRNDRALCPTLIGCYAETEEEALAKIYADVVSKDSDWFGLEAMPVEQYERLGLGQAWED